MMNTLPGPDKGLLDAIFGGGSKPEAAQAVLPGEALEQALASGLAKPADKAQAEGVAKNFSQILDQTQDQKVVAQPQPKGELNQAVASGVQPTKALVAGTTGPKAPVPSAQGKVVEGKSELSSKPVKQERSKPRLAEVTPEQAMAVAAASQPMQQQPAMVTEKQPVAQAEVKAERTHQAAAKPAPLAQNVQPQAQPSQAAGGQKAVQKQASGQQSEVGAAAAALAQTVNPQPSVRQPVVKPTVATKPQQASAMQAQPVATQPTTTVVQPIVIQMPVAVPLLSLEVEGEELMAPVSQSNGQLGSMSRKGSSGRPVLSAEEFLAGRAMGGMADGMTSSQLARSAMERPEGALKSERKLAAESADAAVALMMPQVSRATGDTQLHALNAMTPMNRAPQLDAQNPMAIASAVNGIAARGGGTVKVRLAPENLGELTIAVQSRGKRLDVRFEASNHQAREVLQAAMPELKQALSSARYEVGALDVTTTASQTMNQWASPTSMNDGGSSQQWNQNQNQNQNFRGWERYFDHQDGQQQQGSGGRQYAAYRQYQEAELA